MVNIITLSSLYTCHYWDLLTWEGLSFSYHTGQVPIGNFVHTIQLLAHVCSFHYKVAFRTYIHFKQFRGARPVWIPRPLSYHDFRLWLRKSGWNRKECSSLTVKENRYVCSWSCQLQLTSHPYLWSVNPGHYPDDINQNQFRKVLSWNWSHRELYPGPPHPEPAAQTTEDGKKYFIAPNKLQKRHINSEQRWTYLKEISSN